MIILQHCHLDWLSSLKFYSFTLLLYYLKYRSEYLPTFLTLALHVHTPIIFKDFINPCISFKGGLSYYCIIFATIETFTHLPVCHIQCFFPEYLQNILTSILVYFVVLL